MHINVGENTVVGTKWPTFCKRYFQVHFSKKNRRIFNYFESYVVGLNLVCNGSIDYKSALVQEMIRRREGDKSLAETMKTQFPGAHIPHQSPVSI